MSVSTQELLAEEQAKLTDLDAQRALVQQRIDLLEQLAQLGNSSPVAAAVRVAKPRQTSTISVSTEKRGPGRPRSSDSAKSKQGGKPPGQAPLYKFLEDIARESKKPLPHPEFVSRVLKLGYKSGAGDFSNMVYQSLTKLVKKGTLIKDPQTRAYSYATAA